MTAAIIAIIAAVVPFAIWLWKRRAEKADDPQQQHRKRYEQIEKDIARRDSTGSTLHGGDDLDALDRLRRARDQRRGP